MSGDVIAFLFIAAVFVLAAVSVYLSVKDD